MIRLYWIIATAGFLVLFLLAVIFTEERIALSDSSFYLFHMVKDGNFAVAHFRFIAVFSQLLPVAAIRLKGSLELIMMLFSANLILFQAVVFFCTARADRTGRLAFGVFLVNFLLVSKTFFWGISELVQAMSLMLLYFAFLLRYQGGERKIFLLSMLFIPFLVFGHPLIIIPFSFLLWFFLLSKEISLTTVKTAALWFIALLVLKYTIFRDPYDKGSLGGLRNFYRLFPDYFSIYANRELLKRTVTDFLPLTILFCITAIHYIKQKNKRMLIVILLYSAGMTGFVNICFPYEHTPDFYRENLYTPLAIIIGIPFVYDVLWRHPRRFLIPVTVTLILGIMLFRINTSAGFFEKRIAWMASFMKEYIDEKVVLKETPEHREKITMTWATPYEFWLLSTTRLGRTASVMILDSVKMLPEYKGEGDVFIHRFAAEPYQSFPEQYFRFKDTSSPYRIDLR